MPLRPRGRKPSRKAKKRLVVITAFPSFAHSVSLRLSSLCATSFAIGRDLPRPLKPACLANIDFIARFLNSIIAKI